MPVLLLLLPLVGFSFDSLLGEPDLFLADRQDGGLLIALDAELTQEFRQRRAFDAGTHEVGHGVQAYIEFASVDRVKAVEAADGVVALENADLLSEVRQTDARSQSGHACTDDRDVVVRTGIHAAYYRRGCRSGCAPAREAGRAGRRTLLI